MKKATGTHEWAGKNINIQYGCQNDCKYCYAKAMSVRHKRISIANWSSPILKESLPKSYGKSKHTIMFPSTHDIHEDQIDVISNQLKLMLIIGNKVLIVTKPRLECIKKLCTDLDGFKDQITFRFTIGSTNSEVLKFWEPNAPDFDERMQSLRYAFEHGFATSISCEPLLDFNYGSLVEAVEPYVTESIWLGLMNQSSARLKINGHGDIITQERAKELKMNYSDDVLLSMHLTFADNPKIRWKDSISKRLNTIKQQYNNMSMNG